MSRLVTKPTKWSVHQAKIQISLGIGSVWSESLLCAQWVAKDLTFLHADSEDFDQTGQMPRLIWVFAGRTCHFVGFVMRRLKCSKGFGQTGMLNNADPHLIMVCTVCHSVCIFWAHYCMVTLHYSKFRVYTAFLSDVTFLRIFMNMSRAMRKCVLCHMWTTKARISLRIHAVWSAPLLFAA